jgi:membrane protein required for colicin V production
MQRPPSPGAAMFAAGACCPLAQAQGPEGRQSVLELLSNLGWIDAAALVVLALFFLLGLVKGMAWQLSRIVSLVLAFAVAWRLGPPLAHRYLHAAAADPARLYLAYAILFLATVLLVTIVAYFLRRAFGRADLSFYDRLGGGVAGVATGALVVVAVLFAVQMFVPAGGAVHASADTSRSMGLSRRALGAMGDLVPAPVRRVFRVETGTAALPHQPGLNADLDRPR